jgi:two-component system, chemotaxis family, protein-glutamate methylesterase/glutaminase
MTAAAMPLHAPAAADAPGRRFDAVVIGASAGGVEAICALLLRVRVETRAALFIVLHLPRDRPSLLERVFQERCALPVREAQDKEPVAPGTVYVAPPDYHLLLDEGPRIALSTDEPVNFSRPAIDVLFESAADLYRERLLGIVLTGGNSDGAAGLAAVAAAGGSIVVQHPDSALVSLMPAAALQRNPASRVLSLEGIGRLLASLGETAPA